MNCPKCQKYINDSATFCPYCGKEVEDRRMLRTGKYCINCGKPSVDADPMCAVCRDALNQAKRESQLVKQKHMLLILSICLVIAIAIFLSYVFLKSRDDNEISLYQSEPTSVTESAVDPTMLSTTNATETTMPSIETTTIPPIETTTIPVTEEATTAPTTELPTTETEEAKNSESTENHSPVTIKFWQAGGDSDDASYTMRLLLDNFELLYPWITVNYTAIPWAHEPHEQFQAAIKGGNCADVLVVGSPLDFQFAGEGKLLPLDNMLGSEVLNDMSDIIKRECVYRGNDNPYMQGKIMSVPLYGGAHAMLYNKEIFDHFGVAYPTEGMTHADLLEMAKKLTGDVNGEKVYGYGTRATTAEQYMNFIWNYGGRIIDPATMKATTDSNEWRKGIEDYLAFYEAGAVPEDAATMGGIDLLDMFLNGEIAMFFAAYDYAADIMQTEVASGETPWSEKLGVAPLVGKTYATAYSLADVIVVPSTTQNSMEAGLLVRYLMSTEAQAIYSKNIGFFSCIKSVSYDSYFSGNSILSGYASAMQESHFFGNYGVPGVGAILKEELQKLLNGEISIDEYQKKITAEINAKIEEQGVG